MHQPFKISKLISAYQCCDREPVNIWNGIVKNCIAKNGIVTNVNVENCNDCWYVSQ